MTAYYNEFDPKAAAWLRELITRNLIAPGIVDDRSIADVRPSDLTGFTQCHFFAGIGVWSYALRNASWDDSRTVWTGSCPCQPFSSAGKAQGTADTRHLWPEWFRLIRECRPDTIFGEQVASKAALAWLDVVSTDLESTNYAIGSADLGAASVGAPHVRQRLYWVADTAGSRRNARQFDECQARNKLHEPWSGETNRLDGVALGDTERTRLEGHWRFEQVGNETRRQSSERYSTENGGVNRVEYPNSTRIHPSILRRESGWVVQDCAETRRTGATRGFWRNADWIACRDEKWRPVEPSTFPLAHGTPARVGRLRGYGNAIVTEVATAFIEAYCEVTEVL